MPGSGLTAGELFDAKVLESIQRLRIIANRVRGGGRFADQRSRDLGSGLEFRDFRPYAPGDDIRKVDWNIYRRLGRVFLRLFEEHEDLPLYLMPDVSPSMFLEDPPRIHAALRTSLALAAISLGHHDSVGVFPFAETLDQLVRPQSGKNRLFHFAERLASVEAGKGTDTAAAIRRLGALNLRQGLLVIISDFFDPAGLDVVLESLGHLRHRLLLVQLIRKSDRNPDVTGDLRLVDCESGATSDVSVTAATLARYEEAYDAFTEQLSNFARRRGAGLVQLDVEEKIVPQLAGIFEGGSYVV